MKLSPLFALGAMTLLHAVASLAGEPNTLTPEETAAGWQLLFDGHTTAGWVGIGKTTFPDRGWAVEDGVLIRHSAGGGDLVSTAQFERFEIVWEWKMAKLGGNSGLKYNLADAAKPVGFECQMLGDEKRTGDTHETASLYDLIAARKESVVHPPGEWNTSRVIFDGQKVEHWINETKAVEFTLGSAELTALIAKSKFKSVAGFGLPVKSPILLQDHGSEVAIRSIKIRVLAAPR